jgi:hypothetical protein
LTVLDLAQAPAASARPWTRNSAARCTQSNHPRRSATSEDAARPSSGRRPHGTVLLRTAFGDRFPDLGCHCFFPAARAVEQRLFPTLAAATAPFARAGFGGIALERLIFLRVAPLTEWANRLGQRAISTFEYLAVDQAAVGFARLDAAVAANPGQVEVSEAADLLVMRRREAS